MTSGAQRPKGSMTEHPFNRLSPLPAPRARYRGPAAVSLAALLLPHHGASAFHPCLCLHARQMPIVVGLLQRGGAAPEGCSLLPIPTPGVRSQPGEAQIGRMCGLAWRAEAVGGERGVRRDQPGDMLRPDL